MELFIPLFIGTLMLGCMVAIHAIGLDFIIKHVGKAEHLVRRHMPLLWKPAISGILVVCVFSLHVIQIWLWAVLYLELGCAPLTNLSDALYFATVTYTTLGYGDITLEPAWRMLSGVEAANGFILFGWTTAFIFEVISQLYRQESKKF